MESGVNESMNSEILDQSKTWGDGELPEGEVTKEVHRSGARPGCIGNCNKVPRSPSGPKSTSERDIVFASGPKSCGSSWDVRSELGI